MTTTFSLQVANGVGTLTLQPEPARKPPTLDHASLDALEEVLLSAERASARGELRVLFIVSASERFFCAGANVEALASLDTATIPAWIAHGHRVFARLEDLDVPTVARVAGYALGGGLELALACDLIFATEGAQFGQTEAKLGFVAGWGGTLRLPRRVGCERAKELLLSARIVNASDARAMGLIDFVGTPDAVARHCEQFAVEVIAGSAESHAQHKRRFIHRASRESAVAAETQASLACIRHPDTQARVRAFLARGK